MYDPESERERWRHELLGKLLFRPSALGHFDLQLIQLADELIASFEADEDAETAVMSDWAACLIFPYYGLSTDGRRSYPLYREVQQYCQKVLRCQFRGRPPLWLVYSLGGLLMVSSPRQKPVNYFPLLRGPWDTPVSLPQATRQPIPLRPVPGLEKREWIGWEDIPSITDSLSLRLLPRQAIDDWRKDAHAELDRILDRMQVAAEETFHQMNPTTEDRWRQDAEDLSALCVDGWPPIGEAHKKRLLRFAAFVGIDYPGQKLASKFP